MGDEHTGHEMVPSEVLDDVERAHFGSPEASAAVRMPSMAAMRPLAQSNAST